MCRSQRRPGRSRTAGGPRGEDRTASERHHWRADRDLAAGDVRDDSGGPPALDDHALDLRAVQDLRPRARTMMRERPPEHRLLRSAPAADGARPAVAAAADVAGDDLPREAHGVEAGGEPVVGAAADLLRRHPDVGLDRRVVLVQVVADAGGPPLVAHLGGGPQRGGPVDDRPPPARPPDGDPAIAGRRQAPVQEQGTEAVELGPPKPSSPTIAARSRTSTRFPASASVAAVKPPPGPDPITTTSASAPLARAWGPDRDRAGSGRVGDGRREGAGAPGRVLDAVGEQQRQALEVLEGRALEGDQALAPSRRMNASRSAWSMSARLVGHPGRPPRAAVAGGVGAWPEQQVQLAPERRFAQGVHLGGRSHRCTPSSLAEGRPSAAGRNRSPPRRPWSAQRDGMGGRLSRAGCSPPPIPTPGGRAGAGGARSVPPTLVCSGISVPHVRTLPRPHRLIPHAVPARRDLGIASRTRRPRCPGPWWMGPGRFAPPAGSSPSCSPCSRTGPRMATGSWAGQAQLGIATGMDVGQVYRTLELEQAGQVRSTWTTGTGPGPAAQRAGGSARRVRAAVMKERHDQFDALAVGRAPRPSAGLGRGRGRGRWSTPDTSDAPGWEEFEARLAAASSG